MRVLQIVFCILSCLCVLAAALVGAFLQDLTIVICCILGAVIFGGAMFFVRGQANARDEREAAERKPDFMDPKNKDGNA